MKQLQPLKALGIEMHPSVYIAALIVFIVVGIIVAAEKVQKRHKK